MEMLTVVESLLEVELQVASVSPLEAATLRYWDANSGSVERSKMAVSRSPEQSTVGAGTAGNINLCVSLTPHITIGLGKILF